MNEDESQSQQVYGDYNIQGHEREFFEECIKLAKGEPEIIFKVGFSLQIA